MPDLDTVVEEMSVVNAKWESIGRALFILAHRIYLTEIRNSYSTPHDCLREMLRKWLQEYPANWGHIIMALRKVKEFELADHLKSKYIPGEFANATSKYWLNFNMSSR